MHGLLQLLDDSMELLVSAESSSESAESSGESAAPNLARLVWQPVLAAAALRAFSGARADILSRIKTWQARLFGIDILQRMNPHHRVMCGVLGIVLRVIARLSAIPTLTQRLLTWTHQTPTGCLSSLLMRINSNHQA